MYIYYLNWLTFKLWEKKIDVIEHISYLVSNHKRCFTLTVFLFLYNCTSEVGHTALHNHRNSFTLNYWPRVAIYILCNEISRNLDFKGTLHKWLVRHTYVNVHMFTCIFIIFSSRKQEFLKYFSIFFYLLSSFFLLPTLIKYCQYVIYMSWLMLSRG